LAGKRVKALNVGVGAARSDAYINKRAEMFYRILIWIKRGGVFVINKGWKELQSIRFRAELSGRMKIMGKQEMRKLGIKSPNVADALMLSFAVLDAKVSDDGKREKLARMKAAWRHPASGSVGGRRK